MAKKNAGLAPTEDCPEQNVSWYDLELARCDDGDNEGHGIAVGGDEER